MYRKCVFEYKNKLEGKGYQGMKIVILAAGMGTRLGNSLPKTMTLLANGKTILQNMVDNLSQVFNKRDILMVVGYKKEIIMEAHPDLLYVYNEQFNCTNTASSLLMALEKVSAESVLWLNGDVFFDAGLVRKVPELERSTVFVDSGEVGREEIKYTLDKHGCIRELSKTLENGRGEAVGVNYIKDRDLTLLLEGLRLCTHKDYFERGIEFAIEKGLQIWPQEIDRFFCVEIDFKEDLHQVNRYIEKADRFPR